MDNSLLINFLLLVFLSVNVSGCKLMPYKSDFDCPIPEGQKCKSLYEINKMTDQGLFDLNRDQALISNCTNNSKCRFRK